MYYKIDENGYFLYDFPSEEHPILMETVSIRETVYDYVQQTTTDEEGNEVVVEVPVPREVEREVTRPVTTTKTYVESVIVGDAIYDEEGNLVEEPIYEEITREVLENVLDPSYAAVRPPQPCYKPRWNGTEWIEEGQPPEIIPPEPTEIEKLKSENEEIKLVLDTILMDIL